MVSEYFASACFGPTKKASLSDVKSKDEEGGAVVVVSESCGTTTIESWETGCREVSCVCAAHGGNITFSGSGDKFRLLCLMCSTSDEMNHIVYGEELKHLVVMVIEWYGLESSLSIMGGVHLLRP